MRMHIDTDECNGIITWATYDRANEHDEIVQERNLISAETEDVCGYTCYLGMAKWEDFEADDKIQKHSYRINLCTVKLKLYSHENV